ncbi:MAG: branched-chain amino acid ABC transporter permease, partial [Chloroflexota bacterium]
YAWAWMIAAATATVAGVFLAAFPATLHPALGFVAFRAFPAAIVGGLDSPGGAVVGGLLIGVTEVLVQGYQPQIAPWLGNNFHVVAAYILMILVLMVRPYGLFGTREVERV